MDLVVIISSKEGIFKRDDEIVGVGDMLQEIKPRIPVVKVSEYACMTELSQAVVRRMCENKEPDAFKSNDGEIGGHWYIRVNNNTVPREEYERLLQENTELRTKLSAIAGLVG